MSAFKTILFRQSHQSAPLESATLAQFKKHNFIRIRRIPNKIFTNNKKKSEISN